MPLKHTLRLRRIAAALALLASIAAVASTHGDAAAPTTAPTGDWFAGLSTTAPASLLASGTSIDDPTLFARLYPELARADKTVRAATPRVVFDALDSIGKPQMKLPRMDCEGMVFTDASTRAYIAGRRQDPFVQVFDERRIRIAAIDARKKAASLCFDVETLPLDARAAKPADIDRSVRMITQAVGYARSQDPNLRLFFYSGFPAGDYYSGAAVAGAATTRPSGEQFAWWRASLPDFQAKYEKWSAANALLRRPLAAGNNEAAASLSSLFDGTCPSLYLIDEPTRPGETSGIAPFVRSNLDEARRYGRPVYPFVCFYLVGSKKLVPLNQWTLLIREIVTYADGVVLWDGGDSRWNDGKSLRTRIAVILAEHKGEISDADLYAALRKELPGDAELKAMMDNPATTKQSS